MEERHFWSYRVHEEPKTFWLALWDLLRNDETRGGFMVSRLAYIPRSFEEEKLLDQVFIEIREITRLW